MNHLDVYYRALLNYRKLTAANIECSSLRGAIAGADIEKDRITVKRAFCTIEEDWVDAIEEGLVHIEKAIKEDRQFIRSNGEVVPIEKVKHVSKETTQHLAKHSNLITRYTEGEDIIPDKLYMVERLNDYAVYENRFLYMLLCYLRDFVTIRYNDIVDLTHKYDATLVMDKTISTGRQKLTYSLSMKDVRRDDPYLKEHNPARDVIDRIDLILKAIIAFLSTPLMEEVSKTPMLKPPITKTNVLKMDNNFKGAVRLYDFITSYDKPGYNTELKETVIAPFRDELADEMAEAGALASFLTYQYGLGMRQELKEAYQKEEERLKAEEIKQRKEQIEALKRRLQKSGVGIEEYVLTVEKQLRALEGESARAEALAAEVAERKEKERILNENIERLNGEIVGLKEEMEAERNRHFEEIKALKAAHQDEMHALILKHEAEVERLVEAHRTELSRLYEEMQLLREKQAEEIRQLKEKQEEDARLVREDAERRISANAQACTATVAKAREEADACRAESEKYKSEYDTLLEEKRLTEARLKALGGVDRDYTDKASFNELEAEYNAFTRVYKQQWAKAKKSIRKNLLNIENFRGQKENKDSD